MDILTFWSAIFIVLSIQKIMGKAEDCYLWSWAMTTLVISLITSVLFSFIIGIGLFSSFQGQINAGALATKGFAGMAIASVIISGGFLLISFVFTLRSLYSIRHEIKVETLSKKVHLRADDIESLKKEQDAVTPIYLEEDYEPAVKAISGEREALEAALILTKLERSQLETMYYKFDNSFLTQKWLNRNNLGIAERGVLVHEYFKRGLVSPELNDDYKVFVELKKAYPCFETIINRALNCSQTNQEHARKLAKRFDDKSLSEILPKSFERNDIVLFTYYLAEAYERKLISVVDKTIQLAESIKAEEQRRLEEKRKLEEQLKMDEELKKITGSTLLYNDKAEQNWQAKDKSTYENLKSTFPKYSKDIDQSLDLDDYARYKLEDSYAKLSLEQLKEKLSQGAEAIRKGAFGVVLMRLNELGELKA